MVEVIMNGVRYGVTGGVTAVTLVLTCVVLSPVIVLALGAINGILSLFTSGGNDNE